MEIAAENIATAWEKSVIAILKMYLQKGEKIITERDTVSIEIENMCISVEKPMDEPRVSEYHPNREFLNSYSNNLLDYRYQKHVYSRIIRTEMDNSNINQLDAVIEKLDAQWYTTRGVVAIWDPYIDTYQGHPPCTTQLQFYVRDNRLNLTSYFRSNDAWLCANGDMVALTNLQKTVADKLGIEVGRYTHFACCYHIYEYDISAAFSKFKGRY